MQYFAVLETNCQIKNTVLPTDLKTFRLKLLKLCQILKTTV